MQRKAIAKYFYHSAALKGSGEYALNTILSFVCAGPLVPYLELRFLRMLVCEGSTMCVVRRVSYDHCAAFR